MRTLIIALFVFSTALKADAQEKQAVDLYTLEQFQRRVLQENDTLYVVNFWATSCMPCVKELPHFKELSEAYADRPIKFILMSLDAKDKLEQTSAFIRKKKINIETHLFSAGDPNVWINALEPSWEGSIPATFLYQNGTKLSFKESYFSSKKDLESFIKNHR
jgi:thiol-disulfide isomerase/thioredoxin